MQALGLDVGGTNIRFGVYEGNQLIDSVRVEANLSLLCKDSSTEIAAIEVVRILSSEIVNIIEKHTEIQTVGIGFPGFIHPDSKKIIQSPNLPGLRYFDLRKPLSAILNLPVTIENDANAAAYGEYCLAQKSAHNYRQSLIYLGLGTGVGSGLVLDGKLYTGQHGAAMEIGHMIVEAAGRQCGCGNKGCMEQYASATGVAATYFKATKKQLSAHQIAALASAGDKLAIQSYELAGRVIGQSMANLLKVLDIRNVVIGGGLTAAWPLMQIAFKAQFEADLIPALRAEVQVHVSTAEDTAGMLGAALLSVVPITASKQAL